MSKLVNSAISYGKINGVETEINSNEVEVTLVNELGICKQTDKIVWADDCLAFTIIVKNQTETDVQDVVINDILNPTFVSLITTSVRIDGIPASYGTISYNPKTGLFTIRIPSISALQTTIICFIVRKKLDIPFILCNQATMSIQNSQNDDIASNTVKVISLPSFYRNMANIINLEWRIKKNRFKCKNSTI
ncbi:MAG: hypothetical protein GX247_03595 [Mollicutes bacterium]|nr:hypothetical protein [Mollicutes bacterium]